MSWKQEEDEEGPLLAGIEGDPLNTAKRVFATATTTNTPTRGWGAEGGEKVHIVCVCVCVVCVVACVAAYCHAVNVFLQGGRRGGGGGGRVRFI